MTPHECVTEHVGRLGELLDRCAGQWTVAADWGLQLAKLLPTGARLLVAGNGGSAAQAQHLSAEFVGRYQGERRPYSSIVLHGDTSATTAIANDYGVEEMFARQVEAHGRAGDVCLLMSTSGSSANLLAAARRAAASDLQVWAMTGPRPNPLAELADDVLAVDCAETSTVQEAHLVALHLICEAFDAALAEQERPRLLRVAR